jgi:hypothetical protein
VSLAELPHEYPLWVKRVRPGVVRVAWLVNGEIVQATVNVPRLVSQIFHSHGLTPYAGCQKLAGWIGVDWKTVWRWWKGESCPRSEGIAALLEEARRQ